MAFNLFLDDERDPPRSCDWIIARTFDEATQLVRVLGPPDMMSLDHDLGEGKSGYDFAKWLIDYLIEEDLEADFDYYVHSQNPVGRNNINSLFESFKSFRGKYPHV